MKQRLQELGFEITEDGKHYKLTYYGDNRYFTSVAKTPSDNRTGNNTAGNICRDMM
jgi:ribonuclease BN (tRNA processing enzyme)